MSSAKTAGTCGCSNGLSRSSMARDRTFLRTPARGEISPPNLRWIGRKFGGGGILATKEGSASTVPKGQRGYLEARIEPQDTGKWFYSGPGKVEGGGSEKTPLPHL